MMQLEKIGPAMSGIGQSLHYEIVVRNTGPVPLLNVRIEEQVPAGSRFLRAQPAPEHTGAPPSWSLGTLEPTQERHIQIEVQPASEGVLSSRATASFLVQAGMQTQVVDPRLALTVIGTEAAQVGDPVAFQIQVTNPGTGPATNVVVHDRLPPGLWYEQGSAIDAEIGTLAAGETKDLSLQTTAKQQGRQVNEFWVTGDGGLRASGCAAVNVTQPMLVLRQSGPQRRFLEREAEFHLQVANPGTAVTNDVHVLDVLTGGLEFISASDGGTYDAGTRTIQWRLPALEPGHKHDLVVRVVPKAAGDLATKALAKADRGLEAHSEVVTHVEGMPALTLEVADMDDPIEVGAETTYEIRVKNQGTTAGSNVQVTAIVPDGMAIRDASGPVPHHIDGAQVVFDKLHEVAPRGDAVYRVRVVGQKPGDLRFKVQLMADHLSRPVCEEESTRVYSD
jgi:uncharacterized repeat protein (TIGR01451 family)